VVILDENIVLRS